MLGQLPLGLAFLLLLSLFWIGSSVKSAIRKQKMKSRGDAGGNMEVNTVLAASMGLLALLIGFTFSLALGRYETCRDLIVQEAAAVRMVALRAVNLPPAERGAMIRLSADYAQSRIAFTQTDLDATELRKTHAVSTAIQQRMWEVALRVAERTDTGFVGRWTMDGIANLVRISEERKAAALEHIPARVLSLLTVLAGVVAGIFGYAFAAAAYAHRTLRRVFEGLVALSITGILDLDRPRSGGIQVSDEPLVLTRGEIQQTAAAWSRRSPAP